jgi:hypothetical protein
MRKRQLTYSNGYSLPSSITAVTVVAASGGQGRGKQNRRTFANDGDRAAKTQIIGARSQERRWA